MKRYLVWFVLFVCSCVLPIQSFAQSIALKKMSTHNLTHRWQFTFYLTGPTQYRTFSLHNPNRFILDLKNVHTKERLRYKPLIGTPIKSLRFAYHKDRIFRVVFDLDIPVQATLHELPSGKSGERKLQVLFTKKAHHVKGFDWQGNKKSSPAAKKSHNKSSLLHDTKAVKLSGKKKRAHIVIL